MDGGENIKYGLDFIETVKPLCRVISKLLPLSPQLLRCAFFNTLHALSPPRLLGNVLNTDWKHGNNREHHQW